MSRYAPAALLCSAVITLLAGCQGNGPDTAFTHYLQRLGNSLSVAVPARITSATPRPPRPGKLQLTIASDKLDTLDFLALSGCAVQVTIGKRNSSLGRMARPSQRLLLALEYLRLAPDCIAHLRRHQKASLADTLTQSWQLKRAQLPALIFNATLGGEEYRAFWRPAPSAGEFPPVSSAVVVAALEAINAEAGRWLAGDFAADPLEFEILLGQVAGGDGGVLLKALIRQADWLASADRMLQQRLARGPLCSPGIRHDAADTLPNVVRRYFVAAIQPRAAAMERRYYQLLPPLSALETQLQDTLAAAYRTWQEDRNRHFDRARNAPRQHVQQLGRILQPCTDRTVTLDGKIGYTAATTNPVGSLPGRTHP